MVSPNERVVTRRQLRWLAVETDRLASAIFDAGLTADSRDLTAVSDQIHALEEGRIYTPTV